MFCYNIVTQFSHTDPAFTPIGYDFRVGNLFRYVFPSGIILTNLILKSYVKI